MNLVNGKIKKAIAITVLALVVVLCFSFAFYTYYGVCGVYFIEVENVSYFFACRDGEFFKILGIYRLFRYAFKGGGS